ncbi:hypothetical protein ACR78F_18530 [Sphingobacterium spiritivorum]|uniref:hypothetical protein n=1 Tax=Sphingobacterium spiritivorum TaxID=258 RepID=UPI003DA4EB92
MYIKYCLFGLLMAGASSLCYAQNLLDLNDWKAGEGSAGMFNQNGQTIENTREWGVGPHANRVILWKATPEGNANDDGGWNSNPVAIDHKKMYRSSVWIKKTNSNGGTTYFGCVAVAGLNNVPDNNPYFWNGNLPVLDRWYLLVGYIHAADDPSTQHFGAIYDGTTGEKVIDMVDFKFLPGSTYTNHRTYLYYDPNTNDRQYFYAPRLEVVDGNEPTIEALLSINKGQSEVAYFSGKVGIRTNNPREYDLAVNGKIRSQEVKVEAANWPDYVFKPQYKLQSLEGLENHIKQYGHLPDIPKAEIAEKEGISLGEMNKLLLKKVEELTLYIIEANKQISKQAEQIQLLKSKVNYTK